MSCIGTWASPIALTSPSGNIKVVIDADNGAINYSIYRHGNKLITQNNLSLVLASETLGANPRVTSVSTGQEERTLHPVVALKQSSITSRYRYAVVNFKGNYSLEFRVMDHAVGYRFMIHKRNLVEVIQEPVTITPCISVKATVQTAKAFRCNYEDAYVNFVPSQWSSDQMATAPLLLSATDGSDLQILVGETDVKDYPRMFFRGNGQGDIVSAFPRVPIKWTTAADGGQEIAEEAPYMARTNGKRTMPWRFCVIGSASDLITQSVTTELAAPSELTDTRWIKPGKAAWDWWSQWDIYGPDVDFVAGRNTETYKYFVDFASKNGLEYYFIDDGWAKDRRAPYEARDEVDMKQLISYANQKHVGLMLWVPWFAMENHPDLLRIYDSWGIKGVKIDWMDRSDQWMVNYYERIVKEAAKYHLLVDFHGAFSPSGLEYRYPNLIAYEGVRGLEYHHGCTPANSLWLPFIRNAVGAMDFTPGAMRSQQPEYYFSKEPNYAALGTRAYNMAMYVIFESGVQMLADSPSSYYLNADCMHFLASVPVTWDETRVLEAQPGQAILMARRKGNKWFVGGMNGNNDHECKLNLSLNFLSSGTYRMTAFADGANAARHAEDYTCRTLTVDKSTTWPVTMSRNGGFCAVIEESADNTNTVRPQ